MADRRRRRWVAWDAAFYDGQVGVMIRDRFGPVGLVVFNAFICACKRNLVPGQIEYGTEPDCLAQIGLPGLELVNETGDAWTLQQLWSALAAHKQCTTSRRGRLIQVKSSKWKAWQEDAISERVAERKRRSRATNREPEPDEYEDDDGRWEAAFVPETETDTETETETKNLAPASADAEADPLPAPRPQRPPDQLWDAMLAACGIGEPPTASARGAYNRARKDLADAGATPAEVHRRAGIFRRRWPGVSLTPNGLAKQWAMCAVEPAGAANGRPSTTVDRSIANILEDRNDPHRGGQDSRGPGYGLAPTRALEAGT